MLRLRKDRPLGVTVVGGLLRLRRMRFVREQFYLAATAQNLKRLVRFLRSKPTPELANA
jgi:hypothetical protein